MTLPQILERSSQPLASPLHRSAPHSSRTGWNFSSARTLSQDQKREWIA